MTLWLSPTSCRILLGLRTLDLSIPGLPPLPSPPSISLPLPFPRGPHPLIQLGGLWNAVSSPSWVWGEAPADERFGAYLSQKEQLWWQQFLCVFVHISMPGGQFAHFRDKMSLVRDTGHRGSIPGRSRPFRDGWQAYILSICAIDRLRRSSLAHFYDRQAAQHNLPIIVQFMVQSIGHEKYPAQSMDWFLTGVLRAHGSTVPAVSPIRLPIPNPNPKTHPNPIFNPNPNPKNKRK